MRKTCSALMVAGAAFSFMTVPVEGHAQTASDVQLYGLIGTYIGKMQRSGGPPSVLQVGHGGLTTSFWGIRGKEDLGSGVNAIFAIESFFQPDTGAQGRNATDPFLSRNAYVGFESKAGRFTVGRQTNPTYVNMGSLSPFGVSTVFSPLVLQSFVATYGGAILGDTVWNNAIQYSSPRIGGLAGTVIYGLGEVAGRSGIANLGLHANYLNGPWSAALSIQRLRTPLTAPASQQNAYLAGVTYDFKVAKIYGSVEKTDLTGVKADTRTYDLGLRVPVGSSGALLAEWARTKRETAVSTTRNTASLGYDYFLSKRTDLYAVYSYDKLTPSSSANSYAIGIRHTF